jgi:hypothetical protein
MMRTSDSIGALSAALSKAQGEITGALKDSSNPYFKSKYADLASCWDACRAPLSKNGLAVIQGASTDEHGVSITTRLAHASGEWIEFDLRMAPKDASPQGVGSCITYGRRYGLASVVGLAQIDDDAEAAQGRKGIDPAGKSNLTDDQRTKAEQWAKDMREELLAANLTDEQRKENVLALHQRLMQEDQELYAAAFTLMPSGEKRLWKSITKPELSK